MLTYRPDIDGLRAIAVLSVVIFHLGAPGFAGGYVGVDVFFVISGYLITSIVLRELELGRFSLRTFYFRRIRRLAPALIATVLLTTLAASILMTPYELVTYSRSAVAALFSVSNIVFFLEAGYWDSASELKPLLHTWSLGVEEQFYLFWPALVMLLYGFRSRLPMTLAWIAIAITGYGVCVYATQIDQASAFYLLPFRVFQFALGALVIPLSSWLSETLRFNSSQLKQGGFAVGLGLIVYSVYALGGGVAFPGWVVALPTLGATLVLLSGAGRSGPPRLASALLCNPVSIWIGRVSYAMYLVHWPLFSLYRYIYGSELQPAEQLVLAIGAVLGSTVIHYGIERRFYQRSSAVPAGRDRVSDARFALATLAVVVLMASLSASAWLGDGWSWRSPRMSLSPAMIDAGKERRFDYVRHSCPVQLATTHRACRPDAPLQVLVFGDSHEPDGYNFLKGVFGDAADVNLVSFGTFNRCPDLAPHTSGFVTTDDYCQARLDGLFDPKLLASLDLIVYAANRPFAQKKKEMIDVILALRERRPEIKLAVIGGFINTRRECAWHINQTGVSESCANPANISYFGDAPERASLYPLLDEHIDLFIDRIDLLCEDRSPSSCLTRTPQGIPAFYDKHHLSLEFAVMAGELYERRYPGLLRQTASSQSAEDPR